MPFVDDAASKVIDETIAGEFDMLLGRRTYEIFAAYRPNQGDTPIAKAFNRATKYVVTRSLDKGKRLFENGVPSRGLTLVENRKHAQRCLVNTHHPAGPLPRS